MTSETTIEKALQLTGGHGRGVSCQVKRILKHPRDSTQGKKPRTPADSHKCERATWEVGPAAILKPSYWEEVPSEEKRAPIGQVSAAST